MKWCKVRACFLKMTKICSFSHLYVFFVAFQGLHFSVSWKPSYLQRRNLYLMVFPGRIKVKEHLVARLSYRFLITSV